MKIGSWFGKTLLKMSREQLLVYMISLVVVSKTNQKLSREHFYNLSYKL